MLTPIEDSGMDSLRPEVSPCTVLPTDWSEPTGSTKGRIRDRKAESRALQSRVVSGSLVLLTGTGSVTVMNLIYNIAVVRFLGPTGFGHVAAVCTLLTLISAVRGFVARVPSLEAPIAG